MANNLGGNPWVIDTAGLITSDPLRVQKMRWHPNASDNDCTVCHADGSPIWPIRAIASAANNESVGCEEVDFNPPWPCYGLRVLAIDGGTLYVYVHKVF